VFDKTWLKVLADTRVADLVIRLTADEGNSIRRTGQLTAAYLHEWMHYFQFSVTPVGILMSQYRRSCFLVLRNYFSTDGISSPDEFVEQLASFKANWQAWSFDWYVIGDTRTRDVSRVWLRPDGLRVQLNDLSGTFSLPLGVHALFEAWAWCAEQLYSHTANYVSFEIPKSPDLLKYTWPMWVLADITGKDIDSLDSADLVGVSPILLIAAFYDRTVLSCSGPGTAPKFASAVTELEHRNVTIARIIWQMFRDYRKFWNVHLSLENTDTYMRGIGLPALSTMLDCTNDLLRQSAQICREHIENDQRRYSDQGLTPMMDDTLAEYDILNVSGKNMEIVIGEFDDVLQSPYMVAPKMAPPVCAVEAPDGFEWSTIGFGAQAEAPWREQNESRLLLREQLSITEHIMLQHAFGEHLGCYGSPDWRIPINQCPHALTCMELSTRRGIEFCVDPAWRQKVAYVLQATANAQGIDLADDITPGITDATRELQERFRTPSIDSARPDLSTIEIGWFDGAAPEVDGSCP
jgi:hypothetical protein